MRKLLIGLVLAIVVAAPAHADAGLTASVAAAFLPRGEDAALHTIAHERAVEISACTTCLTHDLMRPDTAEVLGWNSGLDDPVASIVSTWTASPVHRGILSDPGWTRIGCAERVVGQAHYFTCVLAAGALSAIAAPVPRLPDTAMR